MLDVRATVPVASGSVSVSEPFVIVALAFILSVSEPLFNMLIPLVVPLYPRNCTSLLALSWSLPAGYFMIATGISPAVKAETDAVVNPLAPVLICSTFEASTTTQAYQSLLANSPTVKLKSFLEDMLTSIPFRKTFPAATVY